MKVTLIDYTGKGHKLGAATYAAALLIFTKSTRLEMKPDLLDTILNDWPAEEVKKELAYMANTIPSSWEFVDYTWMIQGVTRAFTHQFVRSRQFSFAQQTMRVLNVKGWNYATGPSIKEKEHLKSVYDKMMKQIATTYDALIQQGSLVEDARGILPTNIETNIVAKCNMRTFVELVRKRSSPRTQDEYRQVLDAMKESVRAVHPWIDLFIERTFDKAAKELCDELNSLPEIPDVTATRLIKLVDQMRGQS